MKALKTRKVLDMNVNGYRIYCIFRYDELTDPYHLLFSWYEYNSETNFGWHRKQVGRFKDMIGVIDYIHNFMYHPIDFMIAFKR